MTQANEFVKAPPKGRQWADGDGGGGWLVLGIECPEDGARILYNGNYFCEHWGYLREGQRRGGPCGWALPHLVRTKKNKAICDALGIDYY